MILEKLKKAPMFIYYDSGLILLIFFFRRIVSMQLPISILFCIGVIIAIGEIKGTYSAVRIRVQDLHCDAKFGVKKREETSTRKHIRYLFWLPFEKLALEDKEILDDALSQYPITQELYGFVQVFWDMIHFSDLETFYFLLGSKENYQSKSIRLFIDKLREDPLSIQNALVYTTIMAF